MREALTGRYRGCLRGLAVSDALGTTLEFALPDYFDPIGDVVGAVRFGFRRVPGRRASWIASEPDAGLIRLLVRCPVRVHAAPRRILSVLALNF